MIRKTYLDQRVCLVVSGRDNLLLLDLVNDFLIVQKPLRETFDELHPDHCLFASESSTRPALPHLHPKHRARRHVTRGRAMKPINTYKSNKHLVSLLHLPLRLLLAHPWEQALVELRVDRECRNSVTSSRWRICNNVRLFHLRYHSSIRCTCCSEHRLCSFCMGLHGICPHGEAHKHHASWRSLCCSSTCILVWQCYWAAGGCSYFFVYDV